MAEKKRRIIVTDFEHRLLVKALAQFRNELSALWDISMVAGFFISNFVGKTAFASVNLIIADFTHIHKIYIDSI